MGNSDNRINTSTSSPRLSIRIPRNLTNTTTKIVGKSSSVTFGEGDLMSPRTITVSHPSSSLKEVPRAALFFSDQLPLTSDFGTAVPPTDDLIEMTSILEDPNQGLKALAAASLPTERISSPLEEFVPEPNEDEVLGNLFTSEFEDDLISQMYKEHCREDSISVARGKLTDIIERSDALLQTKGISMSLKSIYPLFIKRIIDLEAVRTGKTDFSNLLTDHLFISASATVILMLPRLISILFRVEEVATSLNANLFDVLLTIEQVLKAFPELMKLSETHKRLSRLEQALLEDYVWKDTGDSSSTLYKLLKSEFKFKMDNCPLPISSTLSGIRSCQRALETLSGFPTFGLKLTRLELFFRKFLRLSSHRLQFATLRLGLNRSVTQLAWELFIDLVKGEACGSGQEKEQEYLFQNRHLNQILMATVYCSSHLLEQERSLQQISQVLPNVSQSNTTWSCKVFKGIPGEYCDFYTFYNEVFIPPLKKRIETFLSRRADQEPDDHDWLLNGLFTTAPFPLDPQYQLAANVTLNRLNQQPKSKGLKPHSTTKYEWLNPITEKQIQDTQMQRQNHIHNHIQNDNFNIISNDQHLRTPSRTSQSQLFNFYSTEPPHPVKRLIDQQEDGRLKKIARKLDFTGNVSDFDE